MNTVAYLKDVVIPNIAEGAKRRGRSRQDVQLYAPIFTASGATPADEDAAIAEVRRQISFYGSTPAYRAVLEHHGGGGDRAPALGRRPRGQMGRDAEARHGRDRRPVRNHRQAERARPQDPRALRRRPRPRLPLLPDRNAEAAEETWKTFVADFRRC
jgi:hypothetical protein